jgi:hypothetical protein
MAGGTAADSVEHVWDDWRQAVTMTASELDSWLDTDESRSVGQGDGESTGHRSGRRIVAILRTRKSDLTPARSADRRRAQVHTAALCSRGPAAHCGW